MDLNPFANFGSSMRESSQEAELEAVLRAVTYAAGREYPNALFWLDCKYLLPGLGILLTLMPLFWVDLTMSRVFEIYLYFAAG